VTIEAAASRNTLHIAISDSGPGIPQQDLARIFDKFYRVPGTSTGGTGLGLSICCGLVEAHGGKLTAENIHGGGARFVVHLPLNGEPPPVQEANL
jgi:two-component system sensor histidine kinase KdpD